MNPLESAWQHLLAGLPPPSANRATVGLAIDTGPHGADLLRIAASLAGKIPGLGYVWIDDSASAEGGARAAQTLVNCGVRLVIGHFNSASALAAAPIYARAGALLLAPGATHPALTAAMPRCFRLCPHDLDQARLFSETLARTGERPLLVAQRIAQGRSLCDAIEHLLLEMGAPPDRFDLDHPGEAADLPTGPVAILSRHAFAGALLSRLEPRPLMLLSDDCHTPHLLKAAGDAALGARVAVIRSADDVTWEEGESAYTQTSRAAIEMLAAAVAIVGSDTDAVATALHCGRWRTSLGITGFDSAGEPIGVAWRWAHVAAPPTWGTG